MYHYVNLDIVMRDCENSEHALRELFKLLPRHPDEFTRHMESYSVELIHSSDDVERYSRSTIDGEKNLEDLLDRVEDSM